MHNKIAKNSVLLLAILASSILVGATNAANAQTTALTVDTDADSYATGDTITVTGQLTTPTITQPILIQVLDPQGNRDRLDQFEAAADGSYSYSFRAGGLMNTDGTYTIRVSYSTTEAETTFEFDASDEEGWSTIQANIGGQNHPIQYMITGGRVVSITGDVENAILLVTLSTQSDGTLSLRFDESIFDADDFFVIFADEIPTFDDPLAGPGATNQIQIDFEHGTEEIEIVGDRIVPEFGAIAAIILAVAIVGIIVATARYSKLGSFVRKEW